jgi:hypothetical protein
MVKAVALADSATVSGPEETARAGAAAK